MSDFLMKIIKMASIAFLIFSQRKNPTFRPDKVQARDLKWTSPEKFFISDKNIT